MNKLFFNSKLGFLGLAVLVIESVKGLSPLLLPLVSLVLFNFGPFWPKVTVHKHQISPFISSLKILGCATNRDMLLLATLQYVDFWPKI